jgi:hypothetical protein
MFSLAGGRAFTQDATPMPDMAGSPVAATPAAGPITFVVSGLSNPRGFTWGDDGALYVALAGIGGQTVQVQVEGFTAVGDPTSSVARVENGCATPVVEGIPSVLWAEAGWIWGAMDVEFLDGQLYVLISGSGESWGTPDAISGIYRVNDDGTTTLVNDISNWLPENPPEFSAPDYSGRDGSEFDMEPSGDAFIVSVADGGQIIRAVPEGEMTMLADLSVQHLVPTGIAVDADGNAYVGFETTPPYPNGASKVVQITPDGTVSDFWTGLTAVTDVEMGPDGVLYAAEMSIDNSEEPPFLNSTTGRIVRQTGPDSLEAVVTDAPPPVGIGFGADGALYFDFPAYGPNAGEGIGAIARVDLSNGPVSFAGVTAPPTCTA